MSTAIAAGASCAYHAERNGLNTCAQCAKRLCGDCSQVVSGRPVCEPCVQAIRDRATSVQAAYAAPAASATDSVPNETLQKAKSSGWGIAAGFGAGLVTTMLWIGLEMVLPFNLSLFAIAVGWITGAAIVFVGGQGGIVPAIAGGLFSLAFIAGNLSLQGYFNDFGSLNPRSMIFVVVCLAFGVWQGFSLPLNAKD